MSQTPNQPADPQQGPPPPGYYYQGPPPKKKHTLRNVLLVLMVGGILLVGGCVALLGGAANEVDKAIKEGENESGGTNNPVRIRPGQAFEVRGFKYKAGWGLENEFGSMGVTKLRVENTRDKRDSALVEIKVWNGKEVVALADCSTEPIAPGTVTRLTCSSTDKLPKKYSKVTINDSF
jgi:hypothetical protein